ncbi:MAG: ABC transporter substrate-binding protein [Acidobacteria bacterium]|nr:ABC transporter substrate-binding protein [Acidobacteriota bacterium]MBS1866507.1 ABC transporter substrate-binding protein [Acidobacteriota bacterium]
MRIVSLSPNATSILCALGVRSSLVGVTRWCPDVAPVKHLPQFGDCWKLESIPKILKRKPDLVIGSVPFKTETLGKLLEHPVRFLALNPRSLADIEADILILAAFVGRNSAATRVIGEMRRAFSRIRRTAHKSAKLRVYCEAWPNPRITSPPWVAELAGICGAKFVGAPGARISEEEVAEADPDVVILAWAATGDRADSAKAYTVEKWRNIGAIRNRRVFVIRDELLNTPAPILVRGAKELARILEKCRSQMRRQQ